MSLSHADVRPGVHKRLVYPHDISKTDTAGINKLYIQITMSLENSFFGVRRSNVKVTRHKTVPACVLCILMTSGFF